MLPDSSKKILYNSLTMLIESNEILSPEFVAQNTGLFFDSKFLPSPFCNFVNSIGSTWDQGSQIGTSFLAKKEDEICLISAWHCFYKKGRFTPRQVIFPNGLTINVDKEDCLIDSEIYQTRDIMIARIGTAPNVAALNLVQSSADLDEEYINSLVISMGYPYYYSRTRNFLSPVASVGKVYDYGKQNIISEARIEGGSSGSPLFNIQGNVIGVMTLGNFFNPFTKRNELSFPNNSAELSDENLIKMIMVINESMQYRPVSSIAARL
jgi:hypothetical protein